MVVCTLPMVCKVLYDKDMIDSNKRVHRMEHKLDEYCPYRSPKREDMFGTVREWEHWVDAITLQMHGIVRNELLTNGSKHSRAFNNHQWGGLGMTPSSHDWAISISKRVEILIGHDSRLSNVRAKPVHLMSGWFDTLESTLDMLSNFTSVNDGEELADLLDVGDWLNDTISKHFVALAHSWAPSSAFSAPLRTCPSLLLKSL